MTKFWVMVLITAGVTAIWFFSASTILETEIRQALIAGLVIMLGWAATFLIQIFSSETERTLQQEDLQLALRAEIKNSYDIFTGRDQSTKSFGDLVVNKILESGDGNDAFHPFIARDSKMIIFEAVKSNLILLPSAVVDEVLQFYCQLADMQSIAAHIMDTDFKSLSSIRRVKAYRHYIQMTIECEQRASDALTMLNFSLGVYTDENTLTALAERRAQTDSRRKSLRSWINTMDQAQSDQSNHAVL